MPIVLPASLNSAQDDNNPVENKTSKANNFTNEMIISSKVWNLKVRFYNRSKIEN